MNIADVKIGTPASIVYPHDTYAAVVVHRTPKRVKVARVETGPRERVDGGSGDTPPIVEARGILDKIVEGTAATYTLRSDFPGHLVGTNSNGGRVTFGESVTRINYQNW